MVGQEQPGDGAEEIAELPLIMKLLVPGFPLAGGRGDDAQDRQDAEEQSCLQFRFHRMRAL